MKRICALLTSFAGLLSVAGAGSAQSILFVGNSFTYGAGSAVHFYRADTVEDLNAEGKGGVPALFRSFTAQAGLDYDVHLETQPGSGLEFHLENRAELIGRRPWDVVVMHGQSTLDFEKPGDPAKLIATTRRMADLLRARNPEVKIHLMATWSRADQTYRPGGPWSGRPIEAMARDVRAAYDSAAAAATGVQAVIPVGEAWSRAIAAGIADGNPYDGIDAGRLNLWTHDHYHASAHGSYLEALVVFGAVTGRDPRSLGDIECSGFELGFSRQEVGALQRVAYEQLAAERLVSANPRTVAEQAGPQRCLVR